MAKRSRTISVNVDIDLDDVITELSDEEILQLAEEIGHSGSPVEVVSRAIVMIRTGRIEDGIAALEREFMPAWKSKAACEAAYRQAMALKVAS